jgi:haloalkane dehalogenase
MQQYCEFLQTSHIPKLMFYAVPGFITPISTVQWAKDHLPNLTLFDIGDGLHYAQEVKPEVFAEELSKWYSTIKS